MYLGVTTGSPATPGLHVESMGFFSDKRVTRSGKLDLSMTFEAKIGITLYQHLGIDRSVRIVTFGASFTHGFMFKDKVSGLFLVTCSAGLVEARETQATAGFHDVSPVRIVTINAVHHVFKNRMMAW